MNQVEKNKAELFEMMEQSAHEPLSLHSIRNMDTMWGAYKVLCLVHEKEHSEEHAEPVKAHPKVPQTP